MVDELRSHQWPSDKILARLDVLDQRFARIETILVGMPDTDERGIVGDVHELFRSRNDCEKDIRAIRERCNMEHGKDPGAKKDSKGLTVWQFVMDNKKAFWPVLVGIFAMGVFAAGIIIELIKKYVALGATP